MKKLILAVAIFSLAFPAAQRAKAADISIDFFYNNLNQGGNWIEVGDYGYCWQPSVAVSNPGWRPYSDGYWAYTNVGWTWVSYEDFGWATYHYGRWSRLRNHGWVWMPGREWGPAWVSWRTGGDYVGWAPLPPRYGASGRELVYQGRPISNTVDIDFDIGPAYYNFVNVRYIGEPVLRDRIFAPTQNITYINQTVNVTNIRYDNSTVYNYGPDYNRLAAYSTRPIRRMTLERQSNVDYGAALRTGSLTKVEGDRLVVAAPQRLEALSPQQQVTPKAVKTRIAKPEVETGWTGISNPKAKAELQQKMKKENPQSVPPPDVKPTNPALLPATPGATGAAANAGSARPAAATPAAEGSSPVAGTSSTAAASPNDREGKGRDKNKAKGQQLGRPTATPANGVTTPNATAPPASQPPADEDGRGRGKKADRLDAAPFPSPAVAEQQKGKDKKKRDAMTPNKPAEATPSDVAAPAGTTASPGIGVKQMNIPELKGEKTKRLLAKEPKGRPSPSAAPGNGRGNDVAPQRDVSAKADISAPADTGRARGAGYARERERLERKYGDDHPRVAPLQENRQRIERQPRPAPPAQQTAPPNAQSAQERGDGKPVKGKKAKKGEETPTPSPGP